jgi:hypothetical protein
MRVTSEISMPGQPVDATQALNLSGVSNCKLLRGRSFIRAPCKICGAKHIHRHRQTPTWRLMSAGCWVWSPTGHVAAKRCTAYDVNTCNLSPFCLRRVRRRILWSCLCFCGVRSERRCASILGRLSARIKRPPGLVYSSAFFVSHFQSFSWQPMSANRHCRLCR